MIILSHKTLSSSTFLHLPRKNPNPRPPRFLCNSEYRTERGLQFDTGESFFRHESGTGRDLGVLAAALHKKSTGKLRVLDALCGCGIRSLRYLIEAEADFVLANDGNDEYSRIILSNLSQVTRGLGEEKRWTVTHLEANRAMTERYLQRDYFDLIDVDSFGSDSTFLRSAISALKLGGLLYVTCTDGFSSGGHRPYHCLAAYGAYVRSVPFCNEVGLRMLIGGALREASVLGYHVTPLFSYYSFHGPVFRVMLRFGRGKLPINRHYGFISYCRQCGHSQTISWDKLGSTNCPCSKANDKVDTTTSEKRKEYQIEVPSSVVIIGPLWTGSLHKGTYITEMLNLAEQWGWTSNDTALDLEKLLRRMIDESDPDLPPGYINLDEVAKRAKVNSPPLKAMMDIMHKEGYAASRSHIASNSIKTNCPMAECMRIARELNGCRAE